MGQKIHPGGLRVGVIHDWKSNWYTGTKEFPAYLLEDIKIREHIYGKLSHAGLSDILIRKDKQRITVDIYTARPGIVIGKSGVEVDALRKELHGLTSKTVHININEIKRPELDAKLVAQSIAEQLAEPRQLPARDEALARVRDPLRRPGREDPVRRPARRHRDEPLRELLRGPRAAAHDPRRHRLRLRRGQDDLRPHRRQGLDQQGRDHARGLRGRRRQRDSRLGDQDQARRRGGSAEGLGASREGGRGRGGDREGLGPVRRRRRAARPGRRRGRRRRRRPRPAARRRPRAAAPAGSSAAATPTAAGPETEPPVDEHAAGRGRRRADRRRRVAEAPTRPSQSPRQPRRRTRARCCSRRRPSTARRSAAAARGHSKGQTTVQFGDYGLKALEAGWVTNRQIEAARIAMTRKIKRGGKVWINVFPDKPVTQKPAETRMGSGKGSPEHWVAVVKPGRVMFELAGVPEPLAKEALRLAGQKLPIKTKFVTREADLFEG